MSRTTVPDEELVNSLLRGLDVLDILGNSEVPMSLAEVARAADTTRATARRFLLTLEHIGYVATNGPTFWLRPKTMELGDTYLDCLGFPAVAHPYLAALAHEVRDTCSLTVLDGDSVVYVDRVKASRVLTVDIAVGTRLPAFATSTGRVLLADLDEEQLRSFLSDLHAEPLTGHTRTDPDSVEQMIATARADGYAIADQELDPVLRSIAAPVRGTNGRTVAAVNVSTHVTRTSLTQLRESILPRLLETSAAISAALIAAEEA